jgi:phosphoglycolate phosphatase-like HAD superfamily hydrolase
MAQITVGDQTFAIDLIIFDKDGTLIDFHHSWAQKARNAVAALVRRVGGEIPLAERLHATLGLEADALEIIPDSPLAIAAMDQLYAIAATVLYQHGLPWFSAEQAVQETFVPILDTLPKREELLPLRDLPSFFMALHEKGITIAVATSDNRTATLQSLALLDVGHLVAALACGDDPLPKKPAPGIVRHLAAECAAPLDRVMVVGDTAGDMIMGEQAGVACRLGVLSGAGKQETLAAHATLVVPSINAIDIA